MTRGGGLLCLRRIKNIRNTNTKLFNTNTNLILCLCYRVLCWCCRFCDSVLSLCLSFRVLCQWCGFCDSVLSLCLCCRFCDSVLFWPVTVIKPIYVDICSPIISVEKKQTQQKKLSSVILSSLLLYIEEMRTSLGEYAVRILPHLILWWRQNRQISRIMD